LKVLTYNVHQWEGQDGRMDVERLARIIEDSHASIVSLNEVLHPLYTSFSQREPLAELAEILGMHWAFGESDRLAYRPGWWGPIGNAVLSRFPIAADKNHYLPRLPLTQGRNLLSADILLDAKRPFTIFSTHLDHAFEGTRLWQLRGVMDRLRSSADRPHLLMGDFNTHTPSSTQDHWFTPPVVRWLRNQGYVDAFALVGEGLPATLKYRVPFFRVDYIFVPETMSQHLVSSRTLRGGLIEIASDHRPVLAEFNWQ
jgi:endonuclease/exonuclease/phosphatase family metal-dependent hydrolase